MDRAVAGAFPFERFIAGAIRRKEKGRCGRWNALPPSNVQPEPKRPDSDRLFVILGPESGPSYLSTAIGSNRSEAEFYDSPHSGDKNECPHIRVNSSQPGSTFTHSTMGLHLGELIYCACGLTHVSAASNAFLVPECEMS